MSKDAAERKRQFEEDFDQINVIAWEKVDKQARAEVQAKLDAFNPQNVPDEEFRYTPRIAHYKNVRRVGAVTQKMGMTNVWDKFGEKRNVTVLRMADCYVVKHDAEPVVLGNGHAYVEVTVGGGVKKGWKCKDWEEEMFAAAGVEPKRQLSKFKVSPDMLPPVGMQVFAGHFVPGQFLDVQSKTRGKGFQGVMKRWNFKGQRATHGVSKTHRQMGSTGGTQGMGKVRKGKKMPGRMGNKNKTIHNLQLYKVDRERNLLWVLGAVPGPEGCFVQIRDSAKIPFRDLATTPAFPYYQPPEDAGAEPASVVMEIKTGDPFADLMN
jgi:large subunit ribosomal protein L3